MVGIGDNNDLLSLGFHMDTEIKEPSKSCMQIMHRGPKVWGTLSYHMQDGKSNTHTLHVHDL